jgi:uncharacterized protein
MRRFGLAFLVLATGWAALAANDVAVPALARRVTDLTGTLSASQADQLEQELMAFEARKGSQLAVLIVPTTAPETIEQFGIRVADQWKLGRKGVDDGALLLVAKRDRTLRIEVGRGLEGVLPDAVASRIVNEVIVPAFKNGDFSGGIGAGVRRMMSVVEGEPLPPPAESRLASGSGLKKLEGLWPFLLFGIPVAGTVLRAAMGRLAAGLVGAGVAGVAAWFLGAPFLVVCFVAIFVALMFAGSSASHGRRGLGSGWSGSSGGWSSGGSGGGFSGGGGSFGGGGASGRW